MKLRIDYVTNSSSSSYIIGLKGKDSLSDALNQATSDLLTDHPYGKMLERLIQDINECIVGCCEEITKEEFLYDIGYESMDEFIENGWSEEYAKCCKFIFDNYSKVFYGSFQDQSDNSIEVMLCYYDLFVHEGDIYIHHEAGY